MLRIAQNIGIMHACIHNEYDDKLQGKKQCEHMCKV